MTTFDGDEEIERDRRHTARGRSADQTEFLTGSKLPIQQWTVTVNSAGRCGGGDLRVLDGLTLDLRRGERRELLIS